MILNLSSHNCKTGIPLFQHYLHTTWPYSLLPYRINIWKKLFPNFLLRNFHLYTYKNYHGLWRLFLWDSSSFPHLAPCPSSSRTLSKGIKKVTVSHWGWRPPPGSMCASGEHDKTRRTADAAEPYVRVALRTLSQPPCKMLGIRSLMHGLCCGRSQPPYKKVGFFFFFLGGVTWLQIAWNFEVM